MIGVMFRISSIGNCGIELRTGFPQESLRNNPITPRLAVFQIVIAAGEARSETKSRCQRIVSVACIALLMMRHRQDHVGFHVEGDVLSLVLKESLQ